MIFDKNEQLEEDKPVIKRASSTRYSLPERRKIIAALEQGQCSYEDTLANYKVTPRQVKDWLISYGSGIEEPIVGIRRSNTQRRLTVQRILSAQLTIEAAARENMVGVGSIKAWLNNPDLSDKLPVKSTMAVDSGHFHDKKQYDFLQMKVAALEMMIDLAEDTYKIDIRKKCGTKQQ